MKEEKYYLEMDRYDRNIKTQSKRGRPGADTTPDDLLYLPKVQPISSHFGFGKSICKTLHHILSPPKN